MTIPPPSFNDRENEVSSFGIPPGDISEIDEPKTPPTGPDHPGNNGAQEEIAAPHVAGIEALEQVTALRRLRAEIQSLQWLFDRVKSGEVSLKIYYPYVQKSRRDIQLLVNTLHGADTIGRIRNNWELMRVNPLIAAPEKELDTQEQLRHLELLASSSSDIIFLIGLITIPSRLNEWLDGSRPGYYIPFHTVFEDELPSQDDRTRLLNLMAYTPDKIHNGFIDPDSGLVYRYNSDPKKRLQSLLWILAALALLTGAAVGACWLNRLLPGWPLTPASAGLVAAGWLALLAGIAVHLGVSEIKRGQSSNGLPPLLALEDLELIVDARKGQIILKIILALVGMFGLVLSTDPAKITLLNFFLVGYSLDSFLDLFVKSVDQKADAQITSLKNQSGAAD